MARLMHAVVFLQQYYLQLQPVHGGSSIFTANTGLMFLQPAQEYNVYTKHSITWYFCNQHMHTISAPSIAEVFFHLGAQNNVMMGQ